MIIDLVAAVDYLKNNDNFLILIHSHPDGDTLGCGLALRYALNALGKKACVLCGDAVPPKFGYMGFADLQCWEVDSIVAVDVADEKLLGADFEAGSAAGFSFASITTVQTAFMPKKRFWTQTRRRRAKLCLKLSAG